MRAINFFPIVQNIFSCGWGPIRAHIILASNYCFTRCLSDGTLNIENFLHNFKLKTQFFRLSDI
jgi:hypothetical protein